MKHLRLIWIGGLLFLAACSNAPETTVKPGEINTQYYQQLQEQLITAEPGATIEIPAGTYEFDRPLSLDGIAGVTIKGAGMDKTVLSFRGQKAGAEGLRITADSVTIQDLTVRDSKGDCIKIQDSKGVYLRNVKTTWSGGAKESNGGYGFYPVASENVLIEDCVASYASDAGIYVGQCRNVIVRNCHAHENVAGIEIENCINAEVYDNLSENNTGGVLVFDMPDLPLVNGHGCKVYNNRILENNHKNFAPEGNIVGIVPPGTGIILLAAKGVEIYNNQIIGNKTIGTAIASFQIAQKPWKDENYNPYTYDVYVHDNTYERGKSFPDRTKDFGKLVNYLFVGKSQDILYDGIVDEKREGKNPMGICIREKGEDLRFANIDAANDFENVTQSLAPYDCNHAALPTVQLN